MRTSVVGSLRELEFATEKYFRIVFPAKLRF